MNLGFFTWAVVAVMLSPYVVLAVKVDKKRMLNYVKVLLDSKPLVWDIGKSLAEYEELLKK